MAQLLPDKDKQGPLAWMLLIGVLIFVYMVGFKWYFDRRAELAEQIDGLLDSEARFSGVIAQRASLQSTLDSIREDQEGNEFFLQQGNASLASSALTTRLKALINEHAIDASKCIVMSNRPARNTGQPGRFEQVAISVQMRCDLEDLTKVFFHMEDATPYLFIDNLNIQKRSTRRREGRKVVTDQYLDVKFDLSGYIQ